jgi:hypothetical protein
MKSVKLFLIFALIGGCVQSGISQGASPQLAPAVHLATAMNHITVLEFGEPVLQAAVGSSAFGVEWRENKVLIKPVKPGASTDLFVWTASRRFTYELDPPGEARNMNYAIDTLPPVTKPVPPPDEKIAEIADMAVTRALMGADRIESGAVKDRRGEVVVRIENVFQSANGLYVRYTVKNLTAAHYRVTRPGIFEVKIQRAEVSLLGIEKTQLDAAILRSVHAGKRTAVVVAGSELGKEDLAPGEETRGVLVLRQQFAAPAVLELNFADAGVRHVAATFVL